MGFELEIEQNIEQYRPREEGLQHHNAGWIDQLGKPARAGSRATRRTAKMIVMDSLSVHVAGSMADSSLLI